MEGSGDGEAFPISLKTNVTLGRYFAASRNILPGEIVLKEDPIIVLPNPSPNNNSKTCMGCCGVTCTSVPCSNCGWPLCKDECGKIHDHADFECDIFAREKIKPTLHPPYCFIANEEYVKVLRCLLLKENDKECYRWNMIMELEAHVELRKGNHKVNVMSKLIRKFIQELCKQSQFEDGSIDHVLGAIDVNAFRNVINPIFQHAKFEKNATVLYRKGSIMAHGCRRNTQSLTFSNGQLCMKAGTHIKEGEVITHAYVDLMLGTLERRALIRDQFYFECCCERCADPREMGTYFSALKCQKCENGYLLLDNPLERFPYWICDNSNCGEIEQTEYEMELLTSLRKEENIILKSERKIGEFIQNWYELLDKYKGKFHENHYAVLQIQLHLIKCIGKVAKPSKTLVEDMVRMINKYKMLYNTFYPHVDE